VIAAVCLVLAAAAISAGQVLKVLNSNRVCGGAAEDVESFLEEFQQQKEVTLLKSAQKGPVMAVIYEREDRHVRGPV